MKNKINLIALTFFISISFYAQDISLYRQINGRYDFTFVGNTLNTNENSYMPVVSILTSSSANLNLNPGDVIESAYLYWAGSGTGDFDVTLNGINITPDRTFAITQASSNLPFFSAFKDITAQVQATGNGVYTLSDLDLTAIIDDYFENRTNFGGWAILIVYQNELLPLNQINIYDGLETIPNEIDVTLTNLNVIDDVGAKIGFIAWEGDANIAVNETLTINGVALSNLPLNPSTNAFNSTNSITNSNELYNMDLDIYDIQNNIAIGDTQAQITMTSGQDQVMINTIITKLNSQLPDATIVLDNYTTVCGTDNFTINYTVYNTNSTDILPANTQIGFYIGADLIETATTQNDIAVEGSEAGSISFDIPLDISEEIIIKAIVDYDFTVTEVIENNNSSEIKIKKLELPNLNILPPLEACNIGLTKGIFDFSNYDDLVIENRGDYLVQFYESLEDALANNAAILNTSNYEANSTPKEIFVRIENEFSCTTTTSFLLTTRNCPPVIYNAVSPDNNGLNDTFSIDGLRDVFVNFKLEIYNRWGKLLWTGDNTTPDWDGYVANGIGSNIAPSGTYFYILHLNDPSYTQPLTGYLYLKR